jgi:hypothetical protein
LANKLNRQFSKEGVQMANKEMKKWSKSLIIKEMQFKIALRFYPPQSDWLLSRKQTTTNAGRM